MASLIPSQVRNVLLRLIEPVAASLIRSRIHPNTITTLGTGLLLASAVGYASGWVRTGGLLLLLAGIGDILDGIVARRRGMTSKFGAFYDSTLDRIGEGAIFTGLALYFLRTEAAVAANWGVMLCMIALSGSLIVSYTRARAESLGFDCKVGVAQRAERILALGIPTLLVGAGQRGQVLLIIVGVLAFVGLITVVQRITHVWRQVSATSSAGTGEGAEAPARKTARDL